METQITGRLAVAVPMNSVSNAEFLVVRNTRIYLQLLLTLWCLSCVYMYTVNIHGEP